MSQDTKETVLVIAFLVKNEWIAEVVFAYVLWF